MINVREGQRVNTSTVIIKNTRRRVNRGVKLVDSRRKREMIN
jgi:hypothetical protein